MKFMHVLNLLSPFFSMATVSGVTSAPTGPTIKPTGPTMFPTGPTMKPTGPTTNPSVTPVIFPTLIPSPVPTNGVTRNPTGPTRSPTGPTIKPSSPPTPFPSPAGAVYTGYKLDVACDGSSGQMTSASLNVVGKCIPQYNGPRSQFIYWVPSSGSNSWAHFVVNGYNDAVCGSLSDSYTAGASDINCRVDTWEG